MKKDQITNTEHLLEKLEALMKEGRVFEEQETDGVKERMKEGYEIQVTPIARPILHNLAKQVCASIEVGSVTNDNVLEIISIAKEFIGIFEIKDKSTSVVKKQNVKTITTGLADGYQGAFNRLDEETKNALPSDCQIHSIKNKAFPSVPALNGKDHDCTPDRDAHLVRTIIYS